MADMFKVGNTFDSFDKFYDLFKNWCNENFHPIHIEDSHAIQDKHLKDTIKYKNVHISCLHAGTWKRPTTGKRRSTSFRRECPFGIKLACGKNSNVLEIKKANFQHNHEISQEIFLKYPKNRKPDANYAPINALLRRIKETLLCLSSDELKDTVQKLNNLANTIKQNTQSDLDSTQERTQSPENKKIKLDSNFDHIFTNEKNK